MDLLRFATAGSVDDGKSTLIGRLLYDSKAIFEDQLEAVERTSRERGDEYTNLALLTDGLRAEREQGITIDVAYRYFATPKRKFIIADTPGHIQYTRNMVTGASTADLAIILVDARKGLVEQSRRHAFLTTLLRVPHLVLCVNKMDLVDYSEEVFEEIRAEFTAFATKLNIPDLTFIPVSALHGDNVVTRVREHALVRRPVAAAPPGERARRLRPQPGRRAVPGAVRHPAAVVGLPTTTAATPGRSPAACSSRATRSSCCRPGFTSRIAAHRHRRRAGRRGVPADVGDGPARGRHRRLARRHDLPAAQPAAGHPGHRRDDLLDGRHAAAATRPEARDQAHHPRRRALVKDLQYRLDVNTLHRDEDADELGLNEIGRVRLRTTQPLLCDQYSRNRTTGGFILIDEATNRTVAAGMITAGD